MRVMIKILPPGEARPVPPPVVQGIKEAAAQVRGVIIPLKVKFTAATVATDAFVTVFHAHAAVTIGTAPILGSESYACSIRMP